MVCKLIGRQSPRSHFVSYGFRNSPVVAHKPQQPLLVLLMGSDDFPALCIGSPGIVVIHADIVAADGAMVVGVGFPVGKGVVFVEDFAPSPFENPGQQFILGGVIVRGAGEGNPVGGVVGHAQPEAVSLDAVIGRSVFTRRIRTHQGQKSAAGVSRNLVSAYRLLQHQEVVAVVPGPFLDPIPLFAEFCVAFAAGDKTYASRGHQVPLIGGIHKHFACEFLTRKGGYRNDPPLFQNHPLLPVKPFIPEYRDGVFADIILEYLFGHMGLKEPHGAVLAIDGGCALPFVSEFCGFLPSPGRIVLIVKPYPVIKVT